MAEVSYVLTSTTINGQPLTGDIVLERVLDTLTIATEDGLISFPCEANSTYLIDGLLICDTVSLSPAGGTMMGQYSSGTQLSGSTVTLNAIVKTTHSIFELTGSLKKDSVLRYRKV